MRRSTATAPLAEVVPIGLLDAGPAEQETGSVSVPSPLPTAERVCPEGAKNRRGENQSRSVGGDLGGSEGVFVPAHRQGLKFPAGVGKSVSPGQVGQAKSDVCASDGNIGVFGVTMRYIGRRRRAGAPPKPVAQPLVCVGSRTFR